MSVPDFQSLMLPVLKVLSDGTARRLSDIRELVAQDQELTPEQRREPLPSGRQTRFANRVNWAVFHLGRAEILKKVHRGVYQIAEEGVQLLGSNPARIDLGDLKKYPGDTKGRKERSVPVLTPEEAIEQAEDQLRKHLETEVLEKVRNAPFDFSENLVFDLLIAMGYGGGDRENGEVTGRSGDHGIDAIINEDALGLDQVFVQVKRYAKDNNVGEPPLRNFAGAIDAAGATKGVFVTTSGFTNQAKKFVRSSPKRIILIDGQRLARLMVKHNVGVRGDTTHVIKRIDEDYFE